MTVTVSEVESGANSGSSRSNTVACGSGDNRSLVALVAYENTSSPNVIGATLGGQAMTALPGFPENGTNGTTLQGQVAFELQADSGALEGDQTLEITFTSDRDFGIGFILATDSPLGVVASDAFASSSSRTTRYSSDPSPGPDNPHTVIDQGNVVVGWHSSKNVASDIIDAFPPITLGPIDSAASNGFEWCLGQQIAGAAEIDYGVTSTTSTQKCISILEFDQDTGPVAPTITANPTSSIAERSATGNVATDTTNGTMYGGVWPAASNPSIADIKAGTGAVAGTASNQAVSSSPLTFPVTGLVEDTAYKFHYVQTDSSAQDSNQAEHAFSTANVAPVVTAQATSDITTTGATGNVATNELNGTMYAGVWPSASTPSIADIKAGTGAVAGTASSAAATSSPLAFPVTGLSVDTTYKFHCVQTDAAGNDSNQDEHQFVTSANPPVIVANATTSIGQNIATGNVSTNKIEGTMYGGVWPAGSSPSPAQIKAGTGAISGTASSQSVTGALTSFPVTGLSPGTDYLFFFIQEDSASADSNSASNAFTTDSVPLVKRVSVRLASLVGVDRASESVDWAFYDSFPVTGVAPSVTGSGTADSNGNITAVVDGTGLNNGQTGYLVEYNANFQAIHAVTVVES